MSEHQAAAAAPGQAAYETHCAAVGLTGDGYAWGKIDRPARERWERIAQAVIAWQHQNAAAAAQPAYRDELENALRIMLMSRDTADAALAIRERTGLLPLKPAAKP